MNGRTRSICSLAAAALAAAGLAVHGPDAWAACLLGLLAVPGGVREWLRLRPRLAGLALLAAAVAASAREPGPAAAALALGIAVTPWVDSELDAATGALAPPCPHAAPSVAGLGRHAVTPPRASMPEGARRWPLLRPEPSKAPRRLPAQTEDQPGPPRAENRRAFSPDGHPPASGRPAGTPSLSRLQQSLAGVALGLAAATWLLRGALPAAAVAASACAAGGLLQAADAVGLRALAWAAALGVLASGRDALRMGARIDGIVLPPGRPYAHVLAGRRDRRRALAMATSLLAGSSDRVAAAVRQTAAEAGVAAGDAEVWRSSAGEVVGLFQGQVVHIGPVAALHRAGLLPMRRQGRPPGPALGIAWAGRVRGLLVPDGGEAALASLGCEVWRRGGRVVPIRRRDDEDAFAIADMLARGRRVAAVTGPGGIAPAADLVVHAGGGLPAGPGPSLAVPDASPTRLAAFLRLAKLTRRLEVALGMGALLAAGPGMVWAATGSLAASDPAWLAVAAAIGLAVGSIFTSSQRPYG